MAGFPGLFYSCVGVGECLCLSVCLSVGLSVSASVSLSVKDLNNNKNVSIEVTNKTEAK